MKEGYNVPCPRVRMRLVRRTAVSWQHEYLVVLSGSAHADRCLRIARVAAERRGKPAWKRGAADSLGSISTVCGSLPNSHAMEHSIHERAARGASIGAVRPRPYRGQTGSRLDVVRPSGEVTTGRQGWLGDVPRPRPDVGGEIRYGAPAGTSLVLLAFS